MRRFGLRKLIAVFHVFGVEVADLGVAEVGSKDLDDLASVDGVVGTPVMAVSRVEE